MASSWIISRETRSGPRWRVRRVLPVLGDRRIDELEPADVADLVSVLHAGGSSRETIRKSVTALAQVLDHAGVSPNPARDRVHVRLPREERAEVNPADGRAWRGRDALLPARYRLPLSFSMRRGCASASSPLSCGGTSMSPAGAGA